MVNVVNVGYDSTNYYVVEHHRKRMLIDAGWPETLPKLKAALKRKGLALTDLHYVFVTHYHPDHAGLVQELKGEGLCHLVLQRQLEFIPRLRTYMKPDSGYSEIELTGSLVFSESESRQILKECGFDGQIIHTPGHSDDSMSLVLDEGIAFIGDLTPPFVEDEVVKRSWAQLAALNVKTYCAGHG